MKKKKMAKRIKDLEVVVKELVYIHTLPKVYGKMPKYTFVDDPQMATYIFQKLKEENKNDT